MLVGFWIKSKFQDTSLHHTSLTPSAGRWSHYLLLKENITDSLGYVGGSEVKKSFACTNEGVFIAKGETNPCGYLTTLMTISFPWLFDLHDSLFNKWVSWTSTLCHIDWQQAHSEDMGDMTRHDLTWQWWYIHAISRVQFLWVMDVFMVYHSFTSA